MVDTLREPAHRQRGNWLFSAAFVVAAIQIALAARLEAATADYCMSVTAAWAGILSRLWESPPAFAPTPRMTSRAVGFAAVTIALVALARGSVYRPVDRLLPLLAGLGLFLLAGGTQGWLHRRTDLLLLSLPVLNPIPEPIRDAIGPTGVTTWCAMVMNRALGHPMTADGSVLRMSGGTIDVISGCSGATSISRLCVLAILIVALFPTNTRQRIGLFAAAAAVGFFANAVRIAILGLSMMQGQEARYDFWHDGQGATVFSIASTVAAGIVWWLLLVFPSPQSVFFRGPLIGPPAPPSRPARDA